MKKFLISIILLTVAVPIFACTSAIISGRVTPDGRPLMWKNRDTNNPKNCVIYLKGEKYDYIAVSAANYASVKAIWMGTNNQGFCIMNTLSYNLSNSEEERNTSQNGSLMKRALEICASIEDFKNFIDTLSKRNVEANYGVIDAMGGAAYFEVGSTDYKIFDVNNPEVAPKGYLVRSNYSVSGNKKTGKGYLRYLRSEQAIDTALTRKSINPQWFFNTLSRSFCNPLTGENLPYTDTKLESPDWRIDQDYIARSKSVSAVVFQGIKKGENPDFTIMWTSIGYPVVTPAVPLWVKGASERLPESVIKNKKINNSLLAEVGTAKRDEVFSYHVGSESEKYFNWDLLFNTKGNGYMQNAIAIENEIFAHSNPIIKKLRKKKELSTKKVFELYDWIDSFLSSKYEEF
jgi:Acyl-coenzyme A:6-aminopenicillanic acid acyl-transferase.